jgi:hypothetical protein
MYYTCKKNLRFYPKDIIVNRVKSIVDIEKDEIEITNVTPEITNVEDEILFKDEKINTKYVNTKKILGNTKHI